MLYCVAASCCIHVHESSLGVLNSENRLEHFQARNHDQFHVKLMAPRSYVHVADYKHKTDMLLVSRSARRDLCDARDCGWGRYRITICEVWVEVGIIDRVKCGISKSCSGSCSNRGKLFDNR